VGFGFGSAGPAVELTASIIFVFYKSRPSEFYGLFHGAFAKGHVGVGMGAYSGWLGVGYNDRWSCLMIAVGVGAALGAGRFVGGAWQM
jgi:hypothetical protein